MSGDMRATRPAPNAVARLGGVNDVWLIPRRVKLWTPGSPLWTSVSVTDRPGCQAATSDSTGAIDAIATSPLLR